MKQILNLNSIKLYIILQGVVFLKGHLYYQSPCRFSVSEIVKISCYQVEGGAGQQVQLQQVQQGQQMIQVSQAGSNSNSNNIIMMVPGSGGAQTTTTTSQQNVQRLPISGPEMLEEEPLYVNAKQYHRILKRKIFFSL